VSNQTWKKTQSIRAQANLVKCIEAANAAIAALQKLGVEARIYGSLADPQRVFREDSDIDICVMNDAGLKSIFIEKVVRDIVGDARLDIFHFSDLKPEIQAEVLEKGLNHVE